MLVLPSLVGWLTLRSHFCSQYYEITFPNTQLQRNGENPLPRRTPVFIVQCFNIPINLTLHFV